MSLTQRAVPILLIIFFFSPGSHAQIKIDVDIDGVDKKLETNIRLFLSVEQQKEHALMTEGRLRRLHKKAPSEISNALQPFGFYRPIIKSELTRTSFGNWRVKYTIDPGPPLRIKTMNLFTNEEIQKDHAFQTFISDIPLHKGDIFNHIEYKNIKTGLVQLGAERGYVNARFTEHRVIVDLKAYEAHISLYYDGGRRYHYGEVRFNQDLLDPELLQRYVTFEKGSPFNLNELIDLQQALNDSNYFHIVEVSPAEVEKNTTEIPIDVSLQPRKYNRYSAGLGYGTDTGARTSFSWEVPRVNRKGHRFNTEAKLSELGYSLSAYYRVPILNPRTDQLIYSIGQINEKSDSSDSTVRTMGAALNRGRKLWRESLSLNYQQEEYIVGSDRGTSTLLMPGVNWQRTWGNHRVARLDGIRFETGLRGAHDSFISDTSFLQLHGGSKVINRLGERHRLIARANLGTTWAQDFHQLPSSVRFFTGGAQSVRGFAYQSLGPKDSGGAIMGGKHLLVGSIELEHSFNDKWGAATFYDVGNALDDFSDKLERGAGLGMRWQSPVGPIRIDLASAISRDNKPWRLHISIGPDL